MRAPALPGRASPRAGAARRRSVELPPGLSTPLDIGNGLVSASIGQAGAWLSLGALHSRHGFVELTGLPAFDPAWRRDPAAVRRYRDWMAQDAFCFLSVEIGSSGGPAAARTLVLGGHTRAAELRGAHYRHEIATWALPGVACVQQRHRVAKVWGDGPTTAVVRFRGRLDAHPLPEITEVDPPPPTGARTLLTAHGDRLGIAAPALPAHAEIHIVVTGATSCGWVLAGDTAQLAVVQGARAAAELEVRIACSLAERAPGTAGIPRRRRRTPRRPGGEPWRLEAAPAGAVGEARLHVPAGLRERLAALAARTRAYVLDCTAMRVAPDEVCLLTDHRILPLSWTRDAYWQAALLLAADAPSGEALDVVGAHLRWLWARCERPAGLWMRSHRPNGAIKDAMLQADQQLYPVLELADYRRVAGELPRAPAGAAAEWWGRRVRELWEALPVTELGLLRSEENPADDRAEMPFPLSSQLLYWLAATRLAKLADELRLDVDFDAVARGIAAAVERHFAVGGPIGRQWAYEVDGRGGHRLYHDANDLPTALAPLVGFCAPTDSLWTGTMRFGFSAHNPAHHSGPWGGLGSLHTPGTWTLGDVQEWVASSLLGERGPAERALARLLAVASPDGLLPEAYDPATGGSPVRRWFAWPGAALGALLGLAL